jgi:chromate transporter
MTTDDVSTQRQVSLGTIAREWTRIGLIGFGGPPAHIALLRRLCVHRRRWMNDAEFEDGIAAANLLPGPASTQLAIYCAWRLRRLPGAIVGGIGFILPGFIAIVALSVLFFARRPPLLVRGAAAGAGAAVAAVALAAALSLVGPSRRRAAANARALARWSAYLVAGGVTAALDGEFLVVVLVACGAIEVVARRAFGRQVPLRAFSPFILGATVTAAGVGALVWEAFKVGALSYGGGFVIIPLMQHDVVHLYHWMSNGQFLTAVALGQITPGPVVLTVAAVGYAASRYSGAVIAAVCAFSPSFAFIIFGAPYFQRLRRSRVAQGVLAGAGPCAIGGIAGSAIPLGLALSHLWQIGVLVAAVLWLVVLRRQIVVGLFAAAAFGLIAAAGGLPVGR